MTLTLHVAGLVACPATSFLGTLGSSSHHHSSLQPNTLWWLLCPCCLLHKLTISVQRNPISWGEKTWSLLTMSWHFHGKDDSLWRICDLGQLHAGLSFWFIYLHGPGTSQVRNEQANMPFECHSSRIWKIYVLILSLSKGYCENWIWQWIKAHHIM